MHQNYKTYLMNDNKEIKYLILFKKDKKLKRKVYPLASCIHLYKYIVNRIKEHLEISQLQEKTGFRKRCLYHLPKHALNPILEKKCISNSDFSDILFVFNGN